MHLSDMVSPHSCVICSAMLWLPTALCRVCLEELWRPELIYSEKEGLSYFSLLHYTKESSRIVKLCKSPERNGANVAFSQIVAEKFLLECTTPVGGVVPMPPRKPGHHDHAFVAAHTVARLLKAPLFAHCLKRGAPPAFASSGGALIATESQKTKSRDARLRTVVVKVDEIEPEKIANKIVLLVDDVATTGATLVQGWSALGRPPAIGLTLASRPLVL